MDDYSSIKEKVFCYYNGYRDKDRQSLGKVFALEVAHM